MIGRASHFLQPRTRNFYQALVDELDPSRQLRFGVLELAGQPIAYHFGFELDRKLVWYQSAFDVGYWEYSPGEVLLGELLRYARERGLREFDFTIGREAYKSRYANQYTENFFVYFDGDSNRIQSRLDHTVHQAQAGFRSIKQSLERRPHARRVIKRNALRMSALLVRARHFLKRGSLVRLSLKAAIALIRNSVWERDELLFFSHTREFPRNGAGPGRRSGSYLRISKGKLGDLAVLSLENPGFLDRTRLNEYRRRLRQGDQVYIGRQGISIAAVAWLGARREIVDSESCTRCRTPLESPALMIYDCRSAPNVPEGEVYDELVAVLAEEAAIQGFDAFTHCSFLSRASRTRMEAAGLRLRRCMIHLKILHWIHHGWTVRTADSLPGPRT
jgi:hypothetical protein